MAETYVGAVRGGVVVFEKAPAPLPEGTKVRIEPVEVETEESKTPTLAERLKSVIHGASGYLLTWRLAHHYFSVNSDDSEHVICRYLRSKTVVDFGSCEVFSMIFVRWRFLTDFRVFLSKVVH